MNHFDEKYRLGPARTTECEATGEHQGDPYEQTDVYGGTWERWTCCDDETLLDEED